MGLTSVDLVVPCYVRNHANVHGYATKKPRLWMGRPMMLQVGSVHVYETTKGARYLVRYRKPDQSQAAKRGFTTKREARAYLASVQASLITRAYVDPSIARVRVSELGTDWLQIRAQS